MHIFQTWINAAQHLQKNFLLSDHDGFIEQLSHSKLIWQMNGYG